MSQVVLKLFILVALLMMLVDALPRRGQGVPDCKKTGCPTNKICARVGINNLCILRHGESCTSKDICEGGYYCVYGNTCSGEAGADEGGDCRGNRCKNGLYCDLNDNKCHKLPDYV